MAVPKRRRATPSAAKGAVLTGGKGGAGMKVGSEVHALFERIAWLKAGEIPKLPRTQAGAMTEGLLRNAEAHKVFEEPEGNVTLHREQGFEVLIDGRWMSGVVDRMHVFRDEAGVVTRVEVYDFKTDRVETAEELDAVYGEQMEAYRKAMAAVFDVEDVTCWLVSTALEAVVEAG